MNFTRRKSCPRTLFREPVEALLGRRLSRVFLGTRSISDYVSDWRLDGNI